ncbi:MAG: AAA family ATPase [Acetatifactor sp.]|nr:AAA family ATPase [Acetatifactor sp.]
MVGNSNEEKKTSNKYDFKRSFYFEAEKSAKNKRITFILGARKCGKTVCMKQLAASLPNAVYVDMKADFDTDEQRRKFTNRILDDIRNDKEATYLIDEATYMALPDKEICKIAGAFSDVINKNTKIVFTGSPSNALEFWGHIACGGNAAFIRTGFLSYPEWLAYRGTTEVSEKTYLDFLLNVRDFYDCFKNTKEYLQGCLDETVISNRKAVEYIVGNSVDELDAEMLLDVLYASLVNLHNHTKYETFANANQFAEMLATGGHYKHFKAMSAFDCKTAMQFLSNCGLTTLTYVSDELAADPYIASTFLQETNEWYRNPQLFARFNLTINYPMFHIDLIENVLKDKMVTELPRDLLGSIVECHVRSLLPTNGCFEYRDSKGVEIDYVSIGGRAIEISVSDKRMRNVNLDILPDDYKKILLTKSMTEEVNGVKRIPYYQFIYDNSTGKELLPEKSIETSRKRNH